MNNNNNNSHDNNNNNNNNNNNDNKNNDNNNNNDIDVPISQRPLSRCIEKVSFDHLLSSASDERSKALTLSTSLPHARDWLQVVPSSALGLHLADREFRSSLQYWLGLRMYEEEYSCSVCKKSADDFGDHQVGCGGNGDRIFRHNAIRDAIFSAAQSAALCLRKEMPSLIPGSHSRRRLLCSSVGCPLPS